MSLPQNDQQSKTNREEHSLASARATRCACLTGRGRSAIAVISVDGPEARAIIQCCVQFASDRPAFVGQVRFGHWTGPQPNKPDQSSEPRDLSEPWEAVVLTAISLKQWEIHCHGGSAAVDRILADLQRCGADPIQPCTTESPLIISEAEDVLARCLTEKTAAVALAQVRGALRDWALGWLSRTPSPEIPPSPEIVASAKSEATLILGTAPWTTRLTEPWRIVLVGAPNVGKSTLLNALVGFDRSITFHQAGTTRDVLHAETVIAGVPVRLSDTAGIRDSREPIEAEGMRRALDAARSADLVVHVEDAMSGGPAELSSFPASVPRIHVQNKIDLIEAKADQSGIDVATSAVTGEGVETLLDRLGEELNRLAPEFDAPVVLNERQTALVAKIATASPDFSLATKLQALIGETLQ